MYVFSLTILYSIKLKILIKYLRLPWTLVVMLFWFFMGFYVFKCKRTDLQLTRPSKAVTQTALLVSAYEDSWLSLQLLYARRERVARGMAKERLKLIIFLYRANFTNPACSVLTQKISFSERNVDITFNKSARDWDHRVFKKRNIKESLSYSTDHLYAAKYRLRKDYSWEIRSSYDSKKKFLTINQLLKKMTW